MQFDQEVSKRAADPEQLEMLYQSAVKTDNLEPFKQAIEKQYFFAPDNLLFAAWYHRLLHEVPQAKGFNIAWSWAVPLAITNGLLFWWLSDDQRYTIQLENVQQGSQYGFLPMILLMAAPISATFVILYFMAVRRKKWGVGSVIAVLLILTAVYVVLVYPQAGTRPFQEQYLTLMLMHLPLLAWASVGLFLLFDQKDEKNRFAFLIKSLEIFVMGGLFAIAGGLFTGITTGLFAALNINLPTLVQRLFIAGGGGLIPVMATAVIYNPNRTPAKQAFQDGLSKLITLIMRILLPLTLLVLVIYLVFIPFNISEPFNNRDVLIIYNGMLFAVIVLLVGATPIDFADLSPTVLRWLRIGIVTVACLALVISLYALTAIVYRTVIDRLTPNRLAFIGWNIINIGLLIVIVRYQLRAKPPEWVAALYRAYRAGTVLYAAWTLLLILIIPWLFGIRQGEIKSLPTAIQSIIYEKQNPILLKCRQSPHIYLLTGGEKRWVEDIETFNDRGYVWGDVQFVMCEDLRAVPDGDPIPANAGPAPQP